MMRRGVLGMVALGLLAPSLVGCGTTSVYRYKMTVEVETPQGLRTGSSVREIIYSEQPKWMPKLPEASTVSTSQKGEAVAVDLPNGQTLFALIALNGYFTLQAAFGDDKPETLDAAMRDKRIVELHPAPGTIPSQSGYPLLVVFKNIRDPKTVLAVGKDDFSKTLGAGYKLRRISVQMTDEPLTTGIKKRLPQADKTGFYNWDGKSNPSDGTVFGTTDFYAGDGM